LHSSCQAIPSHGGRAHHHVTNRSELFAQAVNEIWAGMRPILENKYPNTGSSLADSLFKPMHPPESPQNPSKEPD